MTSFMEFLFCINRHIRKFILSQCKDGAPPPAHPVATPLNGGPKPQDVDGFFLFQNFLFVFCKLY